jgi:hypothetical protein
MCGDPFGLASPFAKASEDKSEATLQGSSTRDDTWAPGALFAEAGGAAVD